MFNRRHSWFIGATLVLTATANHCRAQETKQAASPQAAERVAWRKTMVRVPLPKKGCFQASYPNREWQETPCSKLTIPPLHPQRRGGNPPAVGGGGATDWSAESTGTITLAVGSFLSTNGVASETDSVNGLANSFSLQLNSRPFTNSTTVNLCTGAANPSKCQGWAQFVYDNNSPPPYCPASWRHPILARPLRRSNLPERVVPGRWRLLFEQPGRAAQPGDHHESGSDDGDGWNGRGHGHRDCG